MDTPWGASQGACVEVYPGIVRVDTASHGGYKLSPERMRELRAALPTFQPFAGAPWFEEDCDWAVVALLWPAAFSVTAQAAAIESVLGMKSAYMDPVVTWLNRRDAGGK